jgi:UDP-arabinose 4-epimerase
VVRPSVRLAWTALRYFNAAGADPEGEIEEVHNPETHLIPRAIAAAQGDIPALDLLGTDYDTPDGSAVRGYIHVSDLASAHWKALLRLERGGACRAFNLGTGQGHSVREVISMVEQVSRRSVPVNERPRRPGDPSMLIADPQRAGRELEWMPTHSTLKQVVETAWQWYAGSKIATLRAQCDPAAKEPHPLPSPVGSTF